MASLSLNRLPIAGKIGVGGLLCALLGAAYYVILHTEVAAQIDRAKKTTGDLEAELSRQRQSQASYFADRDELAMRQQKQRELNKVLPMETEAATFLSAIQTVSNISGIDLKAWNPQEEVPQTFFAKVPMRLQISGRFHQIAKFIYEVGKQDRIINIENLELADPKAEGEDIVLKANCLATTFHLIKKPAAPGTPAGAAGAHPAPATPGGK
ncbi:Type IV pilus biogenesis protein PilO [Labilithrix luteola]|uniref:Type IV pilus biogenesis protein PilO n=1 Tax=Labilithrix luteola TaxID=1391654 RepID=A0A0K1PLZ4_9BACT|nr:type 4a pilus biogenesis protein PilO [Labilithrix luteola]AKU94545.1 Type IV pilus biogenesis protein PilO [Labilithrix luteola]